MPKQMTLYVNTGITGSTVHREIGYTEEEWAELNEDRQHEIIEEEVWNLIDHWVAAE